MRHLGLQLQTLPLATGIKPSRMLSSIGADLSLYSQFESLFDSLRFDARCNHKQAGWTKLFEARRRGIWDGVTAYEYLIRWTAYGQALGSFVTVPADRRIQDSGSIDWFHPWICLSSSQSPWWASLGLPLGYVASICLSSSIGSVGMTLALLFGHGASMRLLFSTTFSLENTRRVLEWLRLPHPFHCACASDWTIFPKQSRGPSLESTTSNRLG